MLFSKHQSLITLQSSHSFCFFKKFKKIYTRVVPFFRYLVIFSRINRVVAVYFIDNRNIHLLKIISVPRFSFQKVPPVLLDRFRPSKRQLPNKSIAKTVELVCVPIYTYKYLITFRLLRLIFLQAPLARHSVKVRQQNLTITADATTAVVGHQCFTRPKFPTNNCTFFEYAFKTFHLSVDCG